MNANKRKNNMPHLSGETFEIQLDHLTLAALTWGDPNNPPILALHGWLDNAASFAQLAPLLTDFYVVAVDMPGHGLSDHLPKGTRYHFLDAVDVVIKILDKLGWDKAILMGHSLGGTIATVVAASFPERVAKLVTIDCIGPLSEESVQAPGRLRESVQMFNNAERMQPKTYPDFESMLKMRAKINAVPAALIKPLVERAVKDVADGFVWRFDPDLSLPSLSYFTEEQVLVFLRAIKVPTLLIEASDGVIADNELLLGRKGAIGDLESCWVEGCHHVHLTEADTVGVAVNQFLL